MQRVAHSYFTSSTTCGVRRAAFSVRQRHSDPDPSEPRTGQPRTANQENAFPRPYPPPHPLGDSRPVRWTTPASASSSRAADTEPAPQEPLPEDDDEDDEEPPPGTVATTAGDAPLVLPAGSLA